MKIAYLADHPQIIPALARMVLEDWSAFFGDITWEFVAGIFRQRLNRGRVQLALVAYEGDEPLGTVSLLEESITTHKHLSPWLAALYVAPEWRHLGIATELIDALVKEARAMNIPTLYIGISRAEDFYSERGWEIVDKIIFYNKPVTIMKLDLQPQTI